MFCNILYNYVIVIYTHHSLCWGNWSNKENQRFGIATNRESPLWCLARAAQHASNHHQMQSFLRAWDSPGDFKMIFGRTWTSGGLLRFTGTTYIILMIINTFYCMIINDQQTVFPVFGQITFRSMPSHSLLLTQSRLWLQSWQIQLVQVMYLIGCAGVAIEDRDRSHNNLRNGAT